MVQCGSEVISFLEVQPPLASLPLPVWMILVEANEDGDWSPSRERLQIVLANIRFHGTLWFIFISISVYCPLTGELSRSHEKGSKQSLLPSGTLTHLFLLLLTGRRLERRPLPAINASCRHDVASKCESEYARP